MNTGKPYQVIHHVFDELSLIHDGIYYTYHKDLIDVLHEIDFEVKRRRFNSWAEMQPSAIVKIHVRAENYWHWVVLSESRILFDPKLESPAVSNDFRGREGHGQYLHLTNTAKKRSG